MKRRLNCESFLLVGLLLCISAAESGDQPLTVIEQLQNVENALGEEKQHKTRSIDYAWSRSQSSGTYGLVGYQRSRVCDVFLWQGEGNLTSYDYPFNYPDAIECSYRVPRVDYSCALELTFHDFDVETDGTHCGHDYLQVGSRRFCGHLRSGTKEILDFPYNKAEVVLTFKSDQVNTGRGFWIEVRRIHESCYQLSVPLPPDFNVRSVQGRLTSYAYPDNYRENMNCTYFIEKQPGFCSVELEFIDFDVQDSQGCSRDYFVIEGVRYCGNTLYGRKFILDFHGRNELALVFVADNRGGNRGFDMRYSQVACSNEVPSGRVVDPRPLIPTKPFCNQEFSSRDIYLQSYNYPSFYASDIDCTYTIQRASNDVCELEFTFLNFDVEYDRLCRGDYLEVNGGKICGPLPPGSSRRVRFYGSEMLVKFHSDDTVNRPGFEIRVQQRTDCSDSPHTRIITGQKYCDEEKSSQEFYIQSANYPQYYSNYLDCAYVIRKFSPDVCDLQLTFLSFDLQDDPTCSYDYLEIDGENVCGNVPHGTVRRVPFRNAEILMRFHSDRASSGRGFQIFAQQRRDCSRGYFVQVHSTVPPPSPRPVPPSCDETFRSSEFRIRSLHYPGHYDNNMLCVLRILRTSANVCQLDLVFNAFDLEDDGGCRYDYLEIGGQRLCGFIHQGTTRQVKFDSPEMILRFSSDHTNTRPGFDITIRQLANCAPPAPLPVPTVRIVPPKIIPVPPQITLSKAGTPVYINIPTSTVVKGTQTRIIPPPPLPQTIYVKGSTPVTVRTTSTKGVRVVVPQTNIYPTIVVPPRPTYIDKEQTQLVTYTKGSSSQVRPAPTHYSKGTTNFIPQSGPGRIVQTGRVVPFTYVTSVPSTGCDQVFTTWEFYFQSVNFPLHYGSNVDCVYRAQRFSLSVCEIELHFMSFDVESDPQCSKDYLEVEGERFCGSIPAGTIRRYKSEKPELIIHFHSDHETSGLGFNVLVRQKTQCPVVDTPNVLLTPPVQPAEVPLARVVQTTTTVPIYDFRLTQPSSQFTSLNYPGNYGHGINCTYRISRAKDVCAIELYFYDFDVQSTPNCQSDYLSFGGRKYCGNELHGQTRILYFERSSEAVLTFVSDGDVSGKGWWVFYRQVPCSEGSSNFYVDGGSDLCGQTFAEESGFIKSRNYPLAHYSSNEDCFYSISRVRDDVCALQLTFTDFSLESNTGCTDDYLEIDRRRYCGTDLLHKTVYLNFPLGSDDILLHFKSNDNTEDRGFFAQVKQLSYGCRRTSALSTTVPLQYQERSNKCNRILRSETGTFQSPDFPSSYPPNSECSYSIERVNANVCGLQVDLVHFSLETSRLCLYDYLQTPSGDRLCGNSWTGVQRTIPFPAHENRLVFVFHSDEKMQDQGFSINFLQITSHCP